MASKILVSGIHTIREYPPIALGMCMTYARQEFAGRDGIEVSPRLVVDAAHLRGLVEAGASGERTRHILLFSNYLWNTKINLELSRLAKQLDPSVITIHGGPNTPAYTEASRAFLLAEPHVDYIVAGEGEAALVELLDALLTGEKPIDSIAGLRFMNDGSFVETVSRARAATIDAFPSPYLAGFFDGDDFAKWQSATVETFRGCPYGCTFCDWGSIMGSKVKLFGMERIFAEIDWVASKKIHTLWIADSNFGISERDVEIARYVADVKARTGFPQRMILTFAKNVKSRVVEIVQTLVDAKLLGHGIISLQTTDPETLRVIRRSNIKTSEYEKLRHTFVEKDLPLAVELMVALPGSTVEAFKQDLRYHLDMPIEVFVHRTSMLTNSPMADPAYQREHRIQVDEECRVISTATMSAADIELAFVICRAFQGVHRYGILRYVLRWLEWERGHDPLDVLQDLINDRGALTAYALLREFVEDAGTKFNSLDEFVMTLTAFRQKVSGQDLWASLSTEFISWACKKYALRATDTLYELGRMQAKLMWAPGRLFPAELKLKHDLVRWYGDWLSGNGAPLETYAAAVLRIEGPGARADLGEMETALARCRRLMLARSTETEAA